MMILHLRLSSIPYSNWPLITSGDGIFTCLPLCHKVSIFYDCFDKTWNVEHTLISSCKSNLNITLSTHSTIENGAPTLNLVFRVKHSTIVKLCTINNIFLAQPLLTPHNYVGHFPILARIVSANPSHSTILIVSFSYNKPFYCIKERPTLLQLHSTLTARSVTNDKMWNSIYGSPILNWSLPYQNNTIITRAILGNHPPFGPMPVETVTFSLGWVWWATPPHHINL